MEIADHLGVSLSTVHRMHDEVLMKLRNELAKDPYIQEWLIERKDESMLDEADSFCTLVSLHLILRRVH